MPHPKVDRMEVERLSFIIEPPNAVDGFIEVDESVWNPWLRLQKGFVQKHYQRYPTGRVDIRIFWKSRADWDAAAQSPQLPAVESKFRAQFLLLHGGVYIQL